MTADNQNNPFQPTVSGLASESSKEVSKDRAAYNLISDTITGVNARKGDNAFQAKMTIGSVLLFAAIGVAIVSLMTSWQLPWYAGALVGSFVGMVVGILASGIILMIYRTIRHIQGKHD
jgi:hypothetical protein